MKQGTSRDCNSRSADQSFYFCGSWKFMTVLKANTVEPVYNDIGLSHTSSITSDILWHQLILHC
jgi:hypothetical protein